MNEVPVANFQMATDQFQAQVRGGFGQSLVADVLKPMLKELETLSSMTDDTLREIESIYAQIQESNP